MNVEFDYAHLAPLEPAARIYCALNNQDADEQMAVRHPMGLEVPFSRPAWHFAAEALLNLSTMLAALRRAGEQQSAPARDPRQGELFPQ